MCATFCDEADVALQRPEQREVFPKDSDGYDGFLLKLSLRSDWVPIPTEKPICSRGASRQGGQEVRGLERKGGSDGSTRPFLIYPVFIILMLSFNTVAGGDFVGERIWGLENWRNAWATPELFWALWNTVWLWVVAAAVAFPIAITISWLLARTKIPFSHGLEFLFWIAYVTPGGLVGWIMLFDGQIGLANVALRTLPFVDQGPFNIFSIPGIIFVSIVQSGIALKVMLLTPAFRNMDQVLGAFRTTLVLATSTAIISPILFALLAYIMVRTQWRFRIGLDAVIWVSAAIPGLLSSLGLLLVFLGTPGLEFMYGTIWALLIVVILQGNTTGVNITKGTIVQVGFDMEEAGRVAGAGWWRTFFRIWVPLLAPTLALLALFNFTIAANTTASIVLLASRDTTTASLLILEWLLPGARLREEAAILQIILGTITLTAAFIARRYGITMGIRHH